MSSETEDEREVLDRTQFVSRYRGLERRDPRKVILIGKLGNIQNNRNPDPVVKHNGESPVSLLPY